MYLLNQVTDLVVLITEYTNGNKEFLECESPRLEFSIKSPAYLMYTFLIFFLKNF